jgi:hypothetical protein
MHMSPMLVVAQLPSPRFWNPSCIGHFCTSHSSHLLCSQHVLSPPPLTGSALRNRRRESPVVTTRPCPPGSRLMSVYSRTGTGVLAGAAAAVEAGGPPWLWSYTHAPAARGQHTRQYGIMLFPGSVLIRHLTCWDPLVWVICWPCLVMQALLLTCIRAPQLDDASLPACGEEGCLLTALGSRQRQQVGVLIPCLVQGMTWYPRLYCS